MTATGFNNVLTTAQTLLAEFALTDAFATQLTLAFGSLIDPQAVAQVQQSLADGNYDWPAFEVRSATELQGALAAYAAETRTVYVWHRS